MKNIGKVSDSNRIRNADYHLSKMKAEAEVRWVGKNKERVNKKFKVSY